MYTTLDRVKAELKGTEAQKPTGTDQLLLGYIRQVTARIALFGYDFEPKYYTRKMTPTSMNTNYWLGLLTLGDNLLEPKTITVSGLSVTYGVDVVNFPDDGQSPIRTLRIANTAVGPLRTWYRYNNTPTYTDTIVITGFWGFCQDYSSNGFYDSGQTCPALTATQTSFVVSNVDAVDPYGDTPLFSAGNLIRVDDELMDVIATDTVTNTITVRRGVRGTTKAVHAIGTAVKLWKLEDEIIRCATRQASLLYARRGAFEQVVATDVATATYPQDLVAEIAATLSSLQFAGYI